MSVTTKQESTSSSTSEEAPAVRVKYSEAGNFSIFARDGTVIVVVDLNSLTPEERLAFVASAEHVSVLRDISDLLPGESVTVDGPCSVTDHFGNRYPIHRGSKVDDPDWISQILRIKDPRPIRLLRDGARLEYSTLLEEKLTRRETDGYAIAVLMQKRALQSVQG